MAQKAYPDVNGGGPYHVHAMSRDQAAMGHDVTVVTIDTGVEGPHTEERAGYTVVRYPPTLELLGNDLSVGVGQYLAEAAAFDVIHAHSHLYFSTNLAALKRRFGSIPLAITNHGLYSQTAPEWVFDWYLETVGRWTFDRADAVFCYTEADARRIRGLGVRSDIEVVANGIDVNRFRPEGPGSSRIAHDGPVVLFVGRLVEGKRPEDAIEAVQRVRHDHPDVRLYVCGEGPLRDDLEANAGEGVEFLGQVPYDEIPAVYRSADLLVLPSRTEGLPRTVLEAMGAGVPVVCSALEQVVPIVDGAGQTVPVGDVEGFAGAIERLVAEPGTRDRFGATGRTRIENGFEWDLTVEQTTRTLQRLVDSNST